MKPSISIALASNPVVTSSSTDSVVATMTQLLQAQADANTAQATATTVQYTYQPCLALLHGEGNDATDDGFDKRLEHFQEHIQFPGWSESDQL